MIKVFLSSLVLVSCGFLRPAQNNLEDQIHQLFLKNAAFKEYLQFGNIAKAQDFVDNKNKTIIIILDDQYCQELLISEGGPSQRIDHIALICEFGPGIPLVRFKNAEIQNWLKSGYQGVSQSDHLNFKKYYLTEPDGPRSILVKEGLESSVKIINWNR